MRYRSSASSSSIICFRVRSQSDYIYSFGRLAPLEIKSLIWFSSSGAERSTVAWLLRIFRSRVTSYRPPIGSVTKTDIGPVFEPCTGSGEFSLVMAILCASETFPLEDKFEGEDWSAENEGLLLAGSANWLDLSETETNVFERLLISCRIASIFTLRLFSLHPYLMAKVNAYLLIRLEQRRRWDPCTRWNGTLKAFSTAAFTALSQQFALHFQSPTMEASSHLSSRAMLSGNLARRRLFHIIVLLSSNAFPCCISLHYQGSTRIWAALQVMQHGGVESLGKSGNREIGPPHSRQHCVLLFLTMEYFGLIQGPSATVRGVVSIDGELWSYIADGKAY